MQADLSGEQKKFLPTGIVFSPSNPGDSILAIYHDAFSKKSIPVITREESFDLIQEKFPQILQGIKKGYTMEEAVNQIPPYLNQLSINFKTDENDIDEAWLKIRWKVFVHPILPDKIQKTNWQIFRVSEPQPLKTIIYRLVDSIAASGLLK
jgi:DNA-directed RNA polymerase beta' subunit